jgi:hypothetical protein
MESKGTLVNAAKDFQTNKWHITFAIDILPQIDDLNGKDLRISAVQWKEKRSLTANAYFHVLVRKIARKLHSSMTEVKNTLISDYGEEELNEDGAPVRIALSEKVNWQKVIYLHLRPANEYMGDMAVYYVMRGSHTYSTAEMAALIDGTVSEAKELDIETLAPDELDRLVNMWKPEADHD